MAKTFYINHATRNKILYIGWKNTLGFEIEERRKWAAVRKASVWIPQFIEEGMNASFQLNQQ